MIKVENLVNCNQETQEGLTELTGLEMSEVTGGYASDITFTTGNPLLAAIAGSRVIGKRTSNSVTQDQLSLGVPETVVNFGRDLANTAGGGIYTGPVTAAKLG